MQKRAWCNAPRVQAPDAWEPRRAKALLKCNFEKVMYNSKGFDDIVLTI